MKIDESVRKYILELYVEKNLISPLNEQVPAASRAVFTRLNTVYQKRINDKLGVLLTQRGKDVDGFTVGKTNKGTPVSIDINTGKEFFNNFIAGTLTDRDAKLVFKEIFKSVDDEATIEAMAEYLVKNNLQFVSKYKNKPIEQISNELKDVFGEKQARVLAKKIHSRPFDELSLKKPIKSVKTIGKIMSEASGQAWGSPKFYKIILNLRGSVNGEKSWKLLLRWLFTGTTRPLAKEIGAIRKSYLDNGISPEQSAMFIRLLISVPMEVLQRWVILNGAVTIAKIISEYIYDVKYNKGERLIRLTQEDSDLIVKDITNNWPNYKLQWVWPVETVIRKIILIALSIVRRYEPMQAYRYIINQELPEQRELRELENTYFDPKTVE